MNMLGQPTDKAAPASVDLVEHQWHVQHPEQSVVADE